MTDVSRSPWYRRTLRWGQTNLTEIDPTRYDDRWWRGYWKRTMVQGVIVNAGGIVAYYPSRYPLHHRAEHLGGRDLYGEIAAAAREDGLVVLARMDSNRADEQFYRAHPGWFAVDAQGQPYREGDLYVACVNSPYYDEHIPNVLREIIERSHPDGFADNSWSGLDRARICGCPYCARSFFNATGHPLPVTKDWTNPVYRDWILWNYRRRVEIWDLNNRVTQEAGGPDCLWIGMNGGDLVTQSARFRDYAAICARAELILLDSQSRTNARGFQANAEMGQLIHGILGWEKLIPESMAMYGAGQPSFRVASKPESEARMWVVEGFAGGIQPWWHHIGAFHDDRRQYRIAESLWRWHAAHDEVLVNRQPIATVGVVWWQQNVDFYGRDNPDERFSQPWRGMTQALLRARIPYLPIEADHLEQDSLDLSVLVLPNLGAMTDAQCSAVRRFVQRGGGLIATGEASLYDGWGERRPDFGLADLFGVHRAADPHGSELVTPGAWDAWGRHTYLRLQRQPSAGPGRGAAMGEVLSGFPDTDLIPFGGRLETVRVDDGAVVPLTFVPPFPIYPPETAWMRIPRTSVPGLVLNAPFAGSRVAYLAADLDRCFARDNLPDHADLLANLVRWSAEGRIPLEVEGPGLIDTHLYQQPGRLIVHLVNLSGAGTWRAPLHEIIPVGPLRARVRLPNGVEGRAGRLLVAEREIPTSIDEGWVQVEVPTVHDHEVVVVE